MLFTAVTSAVVAAALGLLAWQQYRRARAALCQAESDRAQAAADLLLARAEIGRIRERRRTHPDAYMLDDLGAILLDIDVELRQSARYLMARLKDADQVIARGRPGPHAYTSTTTTTAARPPRPGAQVCLWKG